MKLDQLRMFLAVLEHGSFTRTAIALDVSQSTVSFQVAGLEDAVGAKLLDRGRGEVQATPSGVILRRYATRILGLVDEAGSAARQEGEVPSGQVQIVASTIPSEYLLPAVIAAFRQDHANVSVRMLSSDSAGAIVELLAQRCDLVVVGSEPDDHRIESAVIARDEVVLVGPADGLEKARDLEDMPLIQREKGSGTRRAVAHLVPGKAVVEVGSTEAARRCVLEGLGYTFISKRAVASDLASGALTLVELPGTPVPRAFHVARRRGATPTAAARALWASLLASEDLVE